jgi:hypothetical protein
VHSAPAKLDQIFKNSYTKSPGRSRRAERP